MTSHLRPLRPLLLIGGLLLTHSLNAAPSLLRRALRPSAPVAASAAAPARMPQLRGQHLPTKIQEHQKTGANWNLTETETYTYDHLGRVTTKTETEPGRNTYRTQYTYVGDTPNIASTLTYISSDKDPAWTPLEREIYTYDSILTTLPILHITQVTPDINANTPDWRTTSISKTLITRNPQGSITHLETLQGPDSTLLTPEYRLSYTIDPATGHPTAIDHETYEDGQWQMTAAYSDLQWDTCNGQVIGLEDILEKPDQANRIKSATIEMYEVEITGKATFDYPDTRGSMHLTVDGKMQNLPLNLDLNLTVLDDNGSYTSTSKALINAGFMKLEQSASEETIYDPFRLLLTYNYNYKSLEGTEIEEKTGTVTYDPATGAPLTYEITAASSDPSANLDPPTRYTFTYGDPSSLPTILPTHASDAPVYYDLRGRRIPTLPSAPGLYLLRQGTHTSKILVK